MTTIDNFNPTGHVYTATQAIRTAEILRLGEDDGWTYRIQPIAETPDRFRIAVYDNLGSFVEFA